MRKFIDAEKEKLKKDSIDHSMAMENILRHLQNFIQTLIVEVATKDSPESLVHAVKGLVAIDDFIKKNIDMSVQMKDRVQLLESAIEVYDKNKALAEKTLEENDRKFRKIGEKPEGIRQTRNVKKNIDLYIEQEDDQEQDS